MDARSTWRGNLVALGFGLVLSCGAAELALRIENPIPLPVRGKRLVLPPNAELVQDSPAPGSPKLEPQVTLRTNSVGLRGEEPPAPDADRVRVITVGGSTTHCRFNSHERSWPGLLARSLTSSVAGVWLNNAGLDGNTTFGHLLLLEQHVLALRPDVVVFLIGVNDIGLAAANQYDAGTDRAIRDAIIEKSELLSTLLVLWRSLRARERGLKNEPILDLASAPRRAFDEAHRAKGRDMVTRALGGYEARVRLLVERTRAAGAEPVLLTQPALWGDVVDPTLHIPLGDIEQPLASFGEPFPTNAAMRWEALELYNEVTRRVGRETGALVIDLAAKMPKDSALYFDWIHFSLEGNERVAQIVASELGPRLAELARR